MSKEKFNWKSLFIQGEKTGNPETPVTDKSSIPETKTSFPSDTTVNADAIPNEVLSKVIELYEKGFESLNQSGYDFYEFFKAVMATDPNNSQSYIMAYTMASSMDKSINKRSLLTSGEFYLNEISKVYTKYDDDGKRLKDTLIDKQKNEKEKLQAEIRTLQNQLIVMQAELGQKTKSLQNYDASNYGKVHEVEQKIIANNLAKDRIVQKISQVITGINNHI